MTEDRAAMHSPDSSDRALGVAAPVVVVGLDGSPSSWDAYCWAAGEANRIGGRLIAVYVTPAVEPVAAVGVPFDYAGAERARDDTACQLKDEAAQLIRDLGVPLSFIREFGDVTHALARVACTQHADLVVVGKSAKLLHHIMGSAGRKLVRRHDAPVVVVVP